LDLEALGLSLYSRGGQTCMYESQIVKSKLQRATTKKSKNANVDDFVHGTSA